MGFSLISGDHYRILFWYEVLLNVALWIVYDPAREFFGVIPWILIILFLLLGIPALLLLYCRAPDRS